MKDNVRRAKQAQRFDRKQIGISRTSPDQMNFPFCHVSITDRHRGKSNASLSPQWGRERDSKSLIRRLTLTHLRVAMKEFIQRIRTLDEAEMLSLRLFYTTNPASTVGTRNGLAEIPLGVPQTMSIQIANGTRGFRQLRHNLGTNTAECGAK